MTNVLATFKQPYVALLGLGGTTWVILLAMLLATHDPKTAVLVGLGFGAAQLTKAATSFGQSAPNTAVALFVCFAVGALMVLYIVGPGTAVEALMDNGLATAISAKIGLYSALLGAAQDRKK